MVRAIIILAANCRRKNQTIRITRDMANQSVVFKEFRESIISLEVSKIVTIFTSCGRAFSNSWSLFFTLAAIAWTRAM